MLGIEQRSPLRTARALDCCLISPFSHIPFFRTCSVSESPTIASNTPHLSHLFPPTTPCNHPLSTGMVSSTLKVSIPPDPLGRSHTLLLVLDSPTRTTHASLSASQVFIFPLHVCPEPLHTSQLRGHPAARRAESRVCGHGWDGLQTMIWALELTGEMTLGEGVGFSWFFMGGALRTVQGIVWSLTRKRWPCQRSGFQGGK